MRVYTAKAVVAMMILGFCASAQAKRHGQKADPLTRRTFNASIENIYAAAVAVAGREWRVISSDAAAHSLTWETTNTRQEMAGGYPTYSVSVTCVAMPAGGTAVKLEVTEHGSDQPSISALVNKSQRRSNMLQTFWDGMEAALKDRAPQEATPSVIQPQQAPTPAAQPPPATPSAGPSPTPSPAPATPSESAPVTPPEKIPQPAVAAEPSLAPSPRTAKLPAAGQPAVLTVKSTPEGADITIDGKFFGDTPTTARLRAGDYAIVIAKAGYKPWRRTVTLTEGGTVTLDADLEGTQ
jgi:PEGA domain